MHIDPFLRNILEEADRMMLVAIFMSEIQSGELSEETKGIPKIIRDNMYEQLQNADPIEKDDRLVLPDIPMSKVINPSVLQELGPMGVKPHVIDWLIARGMVADMGDVLFLPHQEGKLVTLSNLHEMDPADILSQIPHIMMEPPVPEQKETKIHVKDIMKAGQLHMEQLKQKSTGSLRKHKKDTEVMPKAFDDYLHQEPIFEPGLRVVKPSSPASTPRKRIITRLEVPSMTGLRERLHLSGVKQREGDNRFIKGLALLGKYMNVDPVIDADVTYMILPMKEEQAIAIKPRHLKGILQHGWRYVNAHDPCWIFPLSEKQK